MIQIKDKYKCCGCSACVQACPKNCISFDEDEQGFRYPLVNKEHCIDCGLCEKVCPCLNYGVPQKPIKVYSVVNPNEDVRKKSSSGGAFTMIAEVVIDEGGVVFGARFDDKWEVIHDYTETKAGLEAFRGSKYVQSRIGNTYIQARDFLKNGRKVLFTGTSCQIAGLKLFLRKEYVNLLTIDVVCHGVPSPLVWRDYLTELSIDTSGIVDKKSNVPSQIHRDLISGISFRDKISGWKKFSFVMRSSQKHNSQSEDNKDNIILQETLDENLYLQIFLRNLNLRPSCYNCPAKSGKCKSDFTLGDFWGYSNQEARKDDDKGISLVLVNTDVAKGFIRKFEPLVESSYDAAFKGNVTLEHSVQEPKYADVFWNQYKDSGLKAVAAIVNKLKPSAFRVFISRLKISFCNSIIRK
jgi:NAD-dependent dihydropyrimidine dehydrogenase PreA subunit